MYTTRNYAHALFKKTFTRETFLADAAAAGADKVLVGSRFFPERAMYWTRMFRADAEKKGIQLAGIICDSELVTEEADVLEAAKADLLEWIRIAALSRIAALRVRIDGDGTVDEAYVDSLAEALLSVVASAERYGTQLVFSAGTADIGEGLLLRLAKKLGYAACRIASGGSRTNAADSVWFAEPDGE